MDDIRFVLDFAQRGNLGKIIADLEKANALLDKNVQLQKEQAGAVQKAAQDYSAYSKKVEETQRKVQQSSDAKQVIALTAEIGKLRKEYEALNRDIDTLNQKKQKQKEITEQQLQQQIREQANMNKRKAAIREQVKDEQALTYSINTQTRSIQELQNKNNALIRQRKMLDQTTVEGKKKYDELTNAIRRNNAELKRQDADIGSHVRNVGNYQSALKGVGSTMLTLAGITGGVGIIMGLGNAAREASEKFVAFDKVLKELSALTGLTGADLEFFEQQAMKIGSTTRVSAQNYLEAVKLMGSAKPELLSNKEALAQVTEQAILLSDASGMDLPTSIEKLGGFLNSMNLPASEAARVVNTLAAASKFGAKEVPFVAEALSKFGGVAASAGVSVEQSAAAIELLGAKIPQAESVGTGLRNVILELQTAAQGQGREFMGLSKELELLAPKMNDVVFLEKMFGKESILVAQTLIQQRGELDKLTESVTGTSTAIEQAAVNNESWAAQQERANNRLEVSYIKLGKSITPALTRWANLKASMLEFTAELLTVPSQLVSEFQKLETTFEKVSKAGDLFARSAARMRVELATGKITMEEFTNAINYLSKIQDEYNKLTEEGKQTAQEYFNEYQKGTITMEEFSKAMIQVRDEERKARRNDELFNSLTGERLEKAKALKQQYESGRISEKRYRVELLELTKQSELSASTDEARANAINKVTKARKALKKEDDAVREARLGKEKEVTDKDRMDRELSDLEQHYKARKTALVENIDDEDTLRGHQYDLDRNRLEERIRIIEQYEGDSTDARLELAEFEARRRKELYDEDIANNKEANDRKKADDDKALEEEKRRMEERKEFMRNVTDTAIEEARRELESQIELAEQRLQQQQSNVETQQRLAEQGAENTLAFEKQLEAERQKELVEAQRRAERLKRIETYYNLFAAYAEKDPTTAAQKALVQLGVGTAIAAVLEDGGVVADAVAQQNGGVLRGASHKNGGILIEAEGDEGIFSRKEMRRLGKDRFYALKSAINNGEVDNFKFANEQVAQLMYAPQQTIDLSPIREELKDVKRAIEDKPVPSFALDRYGNLITDTRGRGQARITIQRGKGFN